MAEVTTWPVAVVQAVAGGYRRRLERQGISIDAGLCLRAGCGQSAGGEAPAFCEPCTAEVMDELAWMLEGFARVDSADQARVVRMARTLADR